MTKSILWLASYPKSGNTWLRLFLFNYLLDGDRPAPINQAHRLGPGDATAALYRKIGGRAFNPQDPESALGLRAKLFSGLNGNGADVNFVKTHNVNAEAYAVRLIPPGATRGAIYVLRNPLDMAVSYAHHYGMTPDEAAEAIGRADNITLEDEKTVRQYLGGWSAHVRSWAGEKRFPVLTLRYEDMQTAPQETFGKALDFIGAPRNQARLEKAIRFSSFDELKRQETAFGFVEKSDSAAPFFRSGQTGQWKEALSEAAQDRIRREHGAVMRDFGYLDG